MPIQLAQIPNFTVTPAQLQDPVQQAARMATLKNMLSDTALRQQLAPLQIQQQQNTVGQI